MIRKATQTDAPSIARVINSAFEVEREFRKGDRTSADERIRTQRERFAAVFGVRARTKILIESSTESEWVARCLEELGHEVVVADPNFAATCPQRGPDAGLASAVVGSREECEIDARVWS